jgi:hypothetical protein
LNGWGGPWWGVSKRTLNLMEDILSTYFRYAVSVRTQKLNVSGRMLIWTFSCLCERILHTSQWHVYCLCSSLCSLWKEKYCRNVNDFPLSWFRCIATGIGRDWAWFLVVQLILLLQLGESLIGTDSYTVEWTSSVD